RVAVRGAALARRVVPARRPRDARRAGSARAAAERRARGDRRGARPPAELSEDGRGREVRGGERDQGRGQLVERAAEPPAGRGEHGGDRERPRELGGEVAPRALEELAAHRGAEDEGAEVREIRARAVRAEGEPEVQD